MFTIKLKTFQAVWSLIHTPAAHLPALILTHSPVRLLTCSPVRLLTCPPVRCGWVETVFLFFFLQCQFFVRPEAWQTAVLQQRRIMGNTEQHVDDDGFLIQEQVTSTQNRKIQKHWVTIWTESQWETSGIHRNRSYTKLNQSGPNLINTARLLPLASPVYPELLRGGATNLKISYWYNFYWSVCDRPSAIGKDQLIQQGFNLKGYVINIGILL